MDHLDHDKENTEQRVSRREMLEQWKQNRPRTDSVHKVREPYVKPVPFEEILRNDNIVLGFRSKSTQKEAPSVSKGHLSSERLESTVRKLNIGDEIVDNKPEFSSQKEKHIGATFEVYSEAKNSKKPLETRDLNKTDKKTENENNEEEFSNRKKVVKFPSKPKEEGEVKDMSSNKSSQQNISQSKNKIEVENPSTKNSQNKGCSDNLVNKSTVNNTLSSQANLSSHANSYNSGEFSSYFRQDKFPEDALRAEDSQRILDFGKKRKNDDEEPFEQKLGKGDGERNLKKVLLNNDPSKNSQEKSTEKITVQVGNSQEAPVSKKKKVSRKSDANKDNQATPPSNELGSIMKYSIVEVRKGKSVDRVVTPVRRSKRLTIASKSPNSGSSRLSKSKSRASNDATTSSKFSVKFVEDCNDVHFAYNDIEENYKPLDDETIRIREMIRKRRPTPYSKSTKKDEESEDEDEEKEDKVETNEPTKTIQSEVNEVKLIGDKVKKFEVKENREDEIEFEKMIEGNVRGNGNYAFMQLKEKSAKKIGSLRVITPLKEIPAEKVAEATEDIKYVTQKHEDIAYIPRNSEIAKKLESFY